MIRRIRSLTSAIRNLFRIEPTLVGQGKQLLLFIAASGLFSFASGWSPLMRAHPEVLVQGAVVGSALWLLAAVVTVARARFSARFREAFVLARAQNTRLAPFRALGRIVVLSCGAELLFRGMIFGWLALGSGTREGFGFWAVLAFLINALVSAAPQLLRGLGNRLRREALAPWIPEAIRQILLGSALAALYYRTNSLAFAVVARAAFETLETVFMRSDRALKLLGSTAQAQSIKPISQYGRGLSR